MSIFLTPSETLIVSDPIFPSIGSPVLSPVISPVASPLIIDSVDVLSPVVSPLVTSVEVPLVSVETPVVTALSPHSDIIVSPDVLLDSPVVATLDLSYSQPLIGVVENQNLDPDLHRRMIKYYYYLFLDKWLYSNLKDLLNYFVVRGDSVSPIRSMSAYKSDNAKDYKTADVNKIADYIERSVFKKQDMTMLLHRFVRETSTNWYDLSKNEKYLKMDVKRAIIKALKKNMK